MSDSHRILVVDDDFATLDFLRSILELSEGDFEVLGVPSAEEGMLALRRANFNLLVADVRLPGMSGLEMARKAREVSPGIPVIMITGYDSPEAEAEAAALGVVNYFSKPLDAEDFLNAVFEAVEGIHALGIESMVGMEQPPGALVSVEVSRRLETLRADTGAQRVILANLSGEILEISGSSEDEELQRLVTSMAFSMDSSFNLSDRLGAGEPQTIQFLVGDESDLYCANVNREHFLAIFFDAQVRRGRIGTVWVFTRRAIGDLRTMLAEPQTQTADDQAEPGVESPVGTELETGPTVIEQLAPDIAEEVTPEPVEEETESIAEDEPESHAVQSIEPELPEETEEAAGFEHQDEVEAIDQVLNGDSGDSEEQVDQDTDAPDFEDLDLDAFWDDILQGESLDESRGISFEEALRRGIISPDFNPEDE
jgi:CheY-like chemotaxis protein